LSTNPLFFFPPLLSKMGANSPAVVSFPPPPPPFFPPSVAPFGRPPLLMQVPHTSFVLTNPYYFLSCGIFLPPTFFGGTPWPFPACNSSFPPRVFFWEHFFGRTFPPSSLYRPKFRLSRDLFPFYLLSFQICCPLLFVLSYFSGHYWNSSPSLHS